MTPFLLSLYSVENRVINEYGAVGGMRIGRGNRSTQKKPALIAICTPQTSHALTWNRIWAAAVGS
jgi:hypothetical protein